MKGLVLFAMGELIVKFLGKKYTFPEEVKKYVIYCNKFEQIENRFAQELLITMKKPIEGVQDDQIGDIEIRLKEIMIHEGRKIISLLGEDGIYDITESELVYENRGFLYYDAVYKKMMQRIVKNLHNEIQNFADGIEEIQKSTYAQVTGTDIAMCTSSIVDALILEAFETNTIKRQCEKAAKDYDQALAVLISEGKSIHNKEDIKVMYEIYPEIAKAFGIFVSELMEIYLNKLQENSIFDYSKVKIFDIKRSIEILNNIDLVDDKKSVLEQAFIKCPYNPDIYVNLLNLGWCDFDTFVTAKEFYQDSLLVDMVEDYCKENLEDLDKLKNGAAILALYKEKTKIEILRFLYANDLEVIEEKYHILASTLSDRRCLDVWIRKNVSQRTQDIIEMPFEEIEVHFAIKGIITKEEFQRFKSLGILQIELLRLNGSKETELSEINDEIERKVLICLHEYIQEAHKRKNMLDEAYIKYNTEIKKQEEAIQEMQKKLESLSVFSISKKKELKNIISDLQYNLENYKIKNEPINLKRSFDNMFL